jgi:proteic killer suppression protein
MEIVFEKRYLRELYETGTTTDKKHRFQPQVAKKYRQTVDLLESSICIEDLYTIHSLHYKVLVGDKKGISSVRVNNQYRIEFTTSKIESETVITVCNIIELSNHYK